MFRLFSTAVAFLANGCLIPKPATAHAILLESQPAARVTVSPGPFAIRLRFNSRIDHARSRLALRTGQAERALSLDPTSPADVLASSATLATGAYVLRWQVLALDGHVTRGDVPLIVGAP